MVARGLGGPVLGLLVLGTRCSQTGKLPATETVGDRVIDFVHRWPLSHNIARSSWRIGEGALALFTVSEQSEGTPGAGRCHSLETITDDRSGRGC